MMDKVNLFEAIKAFESHLKGFQRVNGLQCRADAPADDFLGVGIENEG